MPKTATRKSSGQDTSDREIVITRVFDAPRERVFEAWADPEQKAKWWGPNGFTVTTHEHDFRSGGKWLLTMHGPDGTDYPNKTLFEEVVRPQRIVYTNSGGKKGAPGVHFRTTVTFKDLGGKTELTLRMVFATAAERDLNVKTYHSIEGGHQTLARLAEHLAKHQKEETTISTKEKSGKKPPFEIVLSRVINAPASRVFKAWSEPTQMAHWFGPNGFTLPVCEMDFRPGGAFRITMSGPDGTDYPFSGKYSEIEPPKRLAWISEFPNGPADQVQTTITFEEHGNKTKLTVRQTFVVLTPETEPYTRGANRGWTETLDRLVAFTTKA